MQSLSILLLHPYHNRHQAFPRPSPASPAAGEAGTAGADIGEGVVVDEAAAEGEDTGAEGAAFLPSRSRPRRFRSEAERVNMSDVYLWKARRICCQQS